MAKRKIIKIDSDKCNGCGLCIPDCPEGAIQLIDGKARLISDLFCDGLGACLGRCPQGAISIEEREAKEYDEKKVMENIARQGKEVISAHLEHLKSHKQKEYLQQALEYLKEKNIPVPVSPSFALRASAGRHGSAAHSGCPGSRVMQFVQKPQRAKALEHAAGAESELRQWPVQLTLVPPNAPYFAGADLLIAADCVPFAYADFHRDLLRGKVLLVGCPKLDDTALYEEKLGQIFKNNQIKSITYAHMEVPCCFGLVGIIQRQIAASGRAIPFREAVISIQGEKLK